MLGKEVGFHSCLPSAQFAGSSSVGRHARSVAGHPRSRSDDVRYRLTREVAGSDAEQEGGAEYRSGRQPRPARRYCPNGEQRSPPWPLPTSHHHPARLEVGRVVWCLSPTHEARFPHSLTLEASEKGRVTAARPRTIAISRPGHKRFLVGTADERTRARAEWEKTPLWTLVVALKTGRFDTETL